MNLYAWTYSSYTIYTASETPSPADTIYNNNGNPITSIGDYDNLTITNVSEDTLTVYYEPM